MDVAVVACVFELSTPRARVYNILSFIKYKIECAVLLSAICAMSCFMEYIQFFFLLRLFPLYCHIESAWFCVDIITLNYAFSIDDNFINYSEVL